MRGAAWDEMILLLLFDEVVFFRLRVAAFDLGSCAWTSHTPGPSREGRFGMILSCWKWGCCVGRFGCCVLVGSESVIWEYSGCLGAVRAAVWRAFGRDGCKLK